MRYIKRVFGLSYSTLRWKRHHQPIWANALRMDARDSIFDVLFAYGMHFFHWNLEFLGVSWLLADILQQRNRYKRRALLKSGARFERLTFHIHHTSAGDIPYVHIYCKPSCYWKSWKNLRSSTFRSLYTSLKSSQWKLVVLQVFRLISLCSYLSAPDRILEMETELYALRKSFYWLSGTGVQLSCDYSSPSIIFAVGDITYIYAVVSRLPLCLIHPLYHPSCHPDKHHARSPPKKFEESSCNRFNIETRTDFRSSGSCRLSSRLSSYGTCSCNIWRRSSWRLLHHLAFARIHSIAIVKSATRVYPQRWNTRGIFRFPGLGWRYTNELVVFDR